jgi:hypothetical protein
MEPVSAVLKTVRRRFVCPCSGGLRQLHTTRRSWEDLPSRSLKVHMASLKSNGNYAKHDGDQSVQVQVPRVI